MLRNLDYSSSHIYLVNPYHLVEVRPWPLVGSVGAMFITRGLVGWFHGWGLSLVLLGLVLVLFTMCQ